MKIKPLHTRIETDLLDIDENMFNIDIKLPTPKVNLFKTEKEFETIVYKKPEKHNENALF